MTKEKSWEERKQEYIRVERKNWEDREINHTIDEKQWEEREIKRFNETASERRAEIATNKREREEHERQAKIAAEERWKPDPSPVAHVTLEDWRDQ